jgi:superfamily II DNA/RNA helicase
VHRIGRTARMGAEGVAVSFAFEDQEDWLRGLVNFTKVPLEELRLEPVKMPPRAERPRRPEGGFSHGGSRGGKGGFSRSREGGYAGSGEGGHEGYGSSRPGGHGSGYGRDSGSRGGSRSGGYGSSRGGSYGGRSGDSHGARRPRRDSGYTGRRR